MPSLMELLYPSGGRQISAQTNQNGAGIVELANEVANESPYSSFGSMYAHQGIDVAALQTPAATPAVSAPAGPSAAYIADKSAKYPGQGVPGNPRPSEYHWWIPGMGWQFMPEYDVGNNLNQQYEAMNPVQLDNAMANGYTHQMSAGSQAVADAQGTTVTTGPQYGYTAQYPENQVASTATTTPAAPAYTLNDINALYVELLGRNGKPENMQYWLDALLNGSQSLDQVRSNIMLSEEYLANQANAAAEADTASEDDGGDTTTTTAGGDDTTTTTTNDGPTLSGYYWAMSGNGWQWFPYYSNEGPPAGAITSGPDAMPSGAPAGWQDPNATSTTTTATTTDTTVEPTPPQLYTPSGDQFFQGMFTANDMLFRDGDTIDSDFYGGLRRNILAGLAQTAADNGRTQNTAEEIALAQGGNNSYSASGLFDPTIAGIAAQLRL